MSTHVGLRHSLFHASLLQNLPCALQSHPCSFCSQRAIFCFLHPRHTYCNASIEIVIYSDTNLFSGVNQTCRTEGQGSNADQASSSFPYCTFFNCPRLPNYLHQMSSRRHRMTSSRNSYHSTPSQSQNDSSSTHKAKIQQRKQFWDTVLDKPHSADNLLDSSPVSEYSDTSHPTANWVLPTHAPNSIPTSRQHSNHHHKPPSSSRPSANILESADKEVESWQKGRKARPYKCSICQSCYAQKGDMVRHMRCVHEGLRPFHCNICGHSFGRRSILNKHVKRHMKRLEADDPDGRSRSEAR